MRMRSYAGRGKLGPVAEEPSSDRVEFELRDVSPSDGEPMTVPPEYTPAKRANVLELDMGDGLILYNHDSSLVHHLNPSAALLWQLCDGDASVARLASGSARGDAIAAERRGG